MKKDQDVSSCGHLRGEVIDSILLKYLRFERACRRKYNGVVNQKRENTKKNYDNDG